MINALTQPQISALNYSALSGYQSELRKAKKEAANQLKQVPATLPVLRGSLILEIAQYNLTLGYINSDFERRADMLPDYYLDEIKAIIYKA